MTIKMSIALKGHKTTKQMNKEDAAQEAAVKMLEKGQNPEHHKGLHTCSARHRLIDGYRRSEREREQRTQHLPELIDRLASSGLQTDPSKNYDRKELLRRLARFLERFSNESIENCLTFEALLMLIEGLSWAEIGAILGEDPLVLQKRVSRLRKLLRAVFGGDR